MNAIELNESLGVSAADAEIIHPATTFPFTPLHNQVVIRVLSDDSIVTSLWIPDNANNKQHSAIGIVIAKGQGHRNRKLGRKGEQPYWEWLGGYYPMDIEPGDYVIFARDSGEAHTIAGESYLLTPVEHIYAVLEGYETDRPLATNRNFGVDAYLDRKYNRPESERPKVIGKNGKDR